MLSFSEIQYIFFWFFLQINLRIILRWIVFNFTSNFSFNEITTCFCCFLNNSFYGSFECICSRFLSMIKKFLLPCKVSNDTNLRMFQYKILNNILYLNKQLFIFNKTDTKLCSYCKLQDETINHVNLLSNYGVIWGIIVNVALLFQF